MKSAWKALKSVFGRGYEPDTAEEGSHDASPERSPELIVACGRRNPFIPQPSTLTDVQDWNPRTDFSTRYFSTSIFEAKFCIRVSQNVIIFSNILTFYILLFWCKLQL